MTTTEKSALAEASTEDLWRELGRRLPPKHFENLLRMDRARLCGNNAENVARIAREAELRYWEQHPERVREARERLDREVEGWRRQREAAEAQAEREAEARFAEERAGAERPAAERLAELEKRLG